MSIRDRAREIERRTKDGEFGPRAVWLFREYRATPRWRLVHRRVVGLRLQRIIHQKLMAEGAAQKQARRWSRSQQH